ncbi:polysaccharide pyruvyl transferase family protein [Stutzerimonas chloritidismutans]|uniref:polysaccharide pyruvyl transferase family protein n=1 Tax=Stutzerimonas chloritidismutans TaxID=203192 RepID=UPI001D1838D3|nr:polysaccharide pyruvyl transferase family protein [Stutzerimonas chloritidismutans]UEG61991.1 polysaccharide pyruvyl transferase family protein [Stutzerimonas chloritidismutans]
MNIYTIEYSGKSFEGWSNLGDDIQSLAAKRLLPRVDGSISREKLKHPVTPGVLSMNGYFLGGVEWPPAPELVPLFFAFHVTPGSVAQVCSPDGIAYLKKHEPIGCRDRGTMELLKRHGVDAFYSKCVTLTLPRREREPENGRVYMVGLSKGAESTVPRSIRRRAVVVDQAKLRLPALTPALKEELSQHLLDTYSRTASLVITSKIHCAMPCIAMGIPVVFIYDKNKKDDYRVSVVKDLIGINYVEESGLGRAVSNRLRSLRINWSPAALEFEEEKKNIRLGYLDALERARKSFESMHGMPCRPDAAALS